MFRTASNSFYKTTSRSTAISSKESKRSIFYQQQKKEEPIANDQGSSELVSNTDRVIAGTPFSILRGKNQQKKEYKATNLFGSDSQTRLPQDIGSLLNEYYV